MFEDNIYYSPDEGSGASGVTPTNSTPAEGTQTQAEVDWSAVSANDVPEDVIKQHPLFQKVLSESIERRKALKDRDQKISQLLQDGEKPEATQTVTQPQQNDSDMPVWAQSLVGKLAAVEQFVQQNQQTTLEMAREAAMKANNLPEKAAEFLTGSTPEEINSQAAKLAGVFSMSNTSPGNAGTQSFAEGLAARAFERLKGHADPMSGTGIFDPGVQKQHKGGSIR